MAKIRLQGDHAMKHDSINININEWMSDTPDRRPIDAMSDILKFFVNRGYRSLEAQVADLLQDFLGHRIDQSTWPRQKRRAPDQPEVYSTCLSKDNSLIFIDFGRHVGIDTPLMIEIDIFSSCKESINKIKELIIDEVMKCFGLTKSRESLLIERNYNTSPITLIQESLTISDPLTEGLFERLREAEDRSILLELKKRGSILERDLHELPLQGVSVERVRRTLDYFSGDEYKLIDKKHAIICKKSGEIIFLLKSKEDIGGVKNLECPKCSISIGNEIFMPYYGITDGLKHLLDSNRWMPMLVRESLIKMGVSRNDIFTEVKYGEDEIDLLVFYKRRILVIETKDRPVNLNDAYKLSAKTSRLESVIASKTKPSPSERYRMEVMDLEDRVHAFGIDYTENLRLTERRSLFIPIVISTYDIAKDAQDLLKETRDATKFLEMCESSLNKFIEEIINEFDRRDADLRFSQLTSTSSDSVNRLAANQLRYAFLFWSKAQE